MGSTLGERGGPRTTAGRITDRVHGVRGEQRHRASLRHVVPHPKPARTRAGGVSSLLGEVATVMPMMIIEARGRYLDRWFD
jgi:hypothetical protein